MTKGAITDNLERSIGRIEGNLSGLVATVSALQVSTIQVQTGVAAIVQDNIQCHTDRADYGKRLSKIEHRQWWVAGASSTVGLVAGWFAHMLNLIVH